MNPELLWDKNILDCAPVFGETLWQIITSGLCTAVQKNANQKLPKTELETSFEHMAVQTTWQFLWI